MKTFYYSVFLSSIMTSHYAASAFTITPLLSSSSSAQQGPATRIKMMASSSSSSSTTSSKLSKLPTLIGKPYYDEVRKQSIAAVQQALKHGLKKIEIEFPIDPGRIDVSLGEFLDESRELAREFIRPFTPKGKDLWVVFPDGKEATLAGKRWGGVNFRIMSIERAKTLPADEPCELQIVITPGFNIEEFLNLEKIDRGVPMIIVNGNLDRVKSGYYPRIFYPGLYAVKERYLKYFEPVFYLKPLQGGFLYRTYPEPWQHILQYYTSDKKGKKLLTSKVVETTAERPVYNDAVNSLKQEALRMMKEQQQQQDE